MDHNGRENDIFHKGAVLICNKKNDFNFHFFIPLIHILLLYFVFFVFADCTYYTGKWPNAISSWKCYGEIKNTFIELILFQKRVTLTPPLLCQCSSPVRPPYANETLNNLHH